jgi:hypothetical protein
MNPDEVCAALILVLQEIQQESGLECPALDGGSIAPEVLPSFDSTVWPVATVMVASKLGVEIPDDVHIFGGQNGDPLLTLAQVSELVCAAAKPIGVQAAAA